MAPPEFVVSKPCPLVPAFVERPILFSAPMVRALLDDSKTQTRRVCKPAEAAGLSFVVEVPDPQERGQVYNGPHFGDEEGGVQFACPYGGVDDRLWVRETYFAWGRWETRYSAKKGRDEWHFVDMTLECGKVYLYAAEGPWSQPLGGKRDGGVTPKWWKRPAIFMPRAASRIDLANTGVRVERLQDISAADAIAEGCAPVRPDDEDARHHYTPRWAYEVLWEQINGAGSWAANPWVWAVEFRRIRPC
jgi:hypothetical protein